MEKPGVFVASSRSSLDVARAIQSNLEFYAEVEVWPEAPFEFTKSTLESLTNFADTMDFGIFVFGPDDILKHEGKERLVVRDNVLFELGLFIGKLGRERNFIVMPRGVSDFHMPTDLTGLTTAQYTPNPKKVSLKSALGSACSDITTAMEDIQAKRNAVRLVSNIDSETPRIDIVSGNRLLLTTAGAPSEVGMLVIRINDNTSSIYVPYTAVTPDNIAALLRKSVETASQPVKVELEFYGSEQLAGLPEDAIMNALSGATDQLQITARTISVLRPFVYVASSLP